MSELHLAPEASFHNQRNYVDKGVATATKPQETQPNDTRIFLQRVTDTIKAVENYNSQSHYLFQLKGLHTAVSKGTVDINEAYAEWAKIVALATPEIKEAEVIEKMKKPANPISKFFKTIFS